MKTPTASDLKAFEVLVRKAYTSKDSAEVRLDNSKRGYCLIYNFWPDSCSETAKDESDSVVSAILDQIDFIYAL